MIISFTTAEDSIIKLCFHCKDIDEIMSEVNSVAEDEDIKNITVDSSRTQYEFISTNHLEWAIKEIIEEDE